MQHDNRLQGLDKADLNPDPIAQFEAWYRDATEAGIPDPNAMVVATASPDGSPSARMVLLKGVDQRGFVFFTNYESRKGRELTENPRAALVFYWPQLSRQVRITGTVSRVSEDESFQYFATRPAASRIAAWASPQSQIISGRDVLDRRVEELQARFDGEIPLPPFWGGFRVTPESIEYWKGRRDRLHDRLRYRRDGAGWVIERLAP